MNKLYIVGIGPGNKDYLTSKALEIIESADILIGGKRNLDEYDYLKKEMFSIDSGLAKLLEFVQHKIARNKIVVLASGDTGIFSIGDYLKRKLSECECVFSPGISSLQYFMAKLCLPWSDARILSLHGKDNVNIVSQLRDCGKLILFTGGKHQAHTIAGDLIDHNENVRVTVGEYLSYDNERIVVGSPSEISRMVFDDLSLVLLEVVKPIESWEYDTCGILNEQFIRDKVPMTKSEVRAVIMSKLRLSKDSKVIDIGSGSGSVTVECGLVAKNGHVWGIERNPVAYQLSLNNVKKFNLDNVTIINNTAPEGLSDLPIPDRLFIGGSGGNLVDILKLYSQVDKTVRVVISAITLETLSEAINAMKELDVADVDICQINVSKAKVAGSYHLMMAENPIYIISGDLV